MKLRESVRTVLMMLAVILPISGCTPSPTPTKPQPTKLSQAQIDTILTEITTDLDADPNLHVEHLELNPGGPFEPSTVWGAMGVEPDRDLQTACDFLLKRVWLSPLGNQSVDVTVGDTLPTLSHDRGRDALDCSPIFAVHPEEMKALYGPRPTDLPAADSTSTSSQSSATS